MLSRGFTLIEVMVTLVILLFGLLGIAGLMAKGQRAAFEAFQRQQALGLANDMAERILSNRARAGCVGNCDANPYYNSGAPLTQPLGTGVSYNDYRTGAIQDCGVSPCSPGQLSAYDLAMWDGLLSGYTEQQVTPTSGNGYVGGIVSALGCIQETANTSASCPPPPASVTPYTRSLRISIAWQGNDDTVVPTNSTCGQNLYTSETKRRVVTLDLTVIEPCD
ncbi:MAG TPA: type IV pilus modification protein PilV [Candidatus Kryptonia bacterium]|nr:type IV pilus modification protein PilV [Candidatus Kryptonia bacterium]